MYRTFDVLPPLHDCADGIPRAVSLDAIIKHMNYRANEALTIPVIDFTRTAVLGLRAEEDCKGYYRRLVEHYAIEGHKVRPYEEARRVLQEQLATIDDKAIRDSWYAAVPALRPH
jgi:hypothetical protein